MPRIGPASDDDAARDEWGMPPFKRLSAEEARRFRQQHPPLSPWRVVAWQLGAMLVLALGGWLLSGRRSVGWSVGYGALAVVVPGAIVARGLTSGLSSMNAGAAVLGFFVWEAVKVAVTVAMLFAAPRLLPGLSWPALLVGLVVTMQVYWAALLWRPKRGN
ncbi:MAG: ATP synthase protein I [Burkholderiaceae bacterium]|jgi:ATP synthase protein I|nr:MAG: ATP synthase protein I [Burkholderiaceae bacterium]